MTQAVRAQDARTHNQGTATTLAPSASIATSNRSASHSPSSETTINFRPRLQRRRDDTNTRGQVGREKDLRRGTLQPRRRSLLTDPLTRVTRIMSEQRHQRLPGGSCRRSTSSGHPGVAQPLHRGRPRARRRRVRAIRHFGGGQQPVTQPGVAEAAPMLGEQEVVDTPGARCGSGRCAPRRAARSSRAATMAADSGTMRSVASLPSAAP